MSSDASTMTLPAPPPWALKGKVWSLPIYVTSKIAAILSSDSPFLYSPCEEASNFSSHKFVGGVAIVQVIRYVESPVGPYDELVIVPGDFEWVSQVKNKDGNLKSKRIKHSRVTKIFVSQKETCWNGRKNWNVPKHLARFTFTDLPDGSMSVSVYPSETSSSASTLAVTAQEAPFFTATYRPISYLPSFHVSTAWMKYLGLDTTFVQPPLPHGPTPELVGTEEWCKVPFLEVSKKSSLGWWDLKQSVGEEDALLGREDGRGSREERKGGYENWWPGIGRWRLGMCMEDTEINCPAGEHWKEDED